MLTRAQAQIALLRRPRGCGALTQAQPSCQGETLGCVFVTRRPGSLGAWRPRRCLRPRGRDVRLGPWFGPGSLQFRSGSVRTYLVGDAHRHLSPFIGHKRRMRALSRACGDSGKRAPIGDTEGYGLPEESVWPNRKTVFPARPVVASPRPGCRVGAVRSPRQGRRGRHLRRGRRGDRVTRWGHGDGGQEYSEEGEERDRDNAGDRVSAG